MIGACDRRWVSVFSYDLNLGRPRFIIETREPLLPGRWVVLDVGLLLTDPPGGVPAGVVEPAALAETERCWIASMARCLGLSMGLASGDDAMRRAATVADFVRGGKAFAAIAEGSPFPIPFAPVCG